MDLPPLLHQEVIVYVAISVTRLNMLHGFVVGRLSVFMNCVTLSFIQCLVFHSSMRHE